MNIWQKLFGKKPKQPKAEEVKEKTTARQDKRSAATMSIKCAKCMTEFDWEQAYLQRDTPGSYEHNPPGHGDFRPRTFCPHCGFLIAEWDIDRYQDRDRWKWYGENARVNAGRELPPSPLDLWGQDILPGSRATVWEDHIDIKLVTRLLGEDTTSEVELIELSAATQLEVDLSASLVEHDEQLPDFSGFKTKDPAQVVSVLFEQALPATPTVTAEEVKGEYSSLRRAWRSKKLYSGTLDEVRKIILRNVTRYAHLNTFEVFRVSVDKREKCAQIDSFICFPDGTPSHFIGIRVWRSEHKLFACGSDFQYEDAPKEVEELERRAEKEARYLIATKQWDALEELGEPAVEPLIQALKDRDIYTQKRAAQILGGLGDSRAVKPLIRVLKDEIDSIFTQWVAEALGKIGDARAVEPLAHALKSKDFLVRRKAAGALGKIGDARALEPLIQVLKNGDRDWHVVRGAAEALGEIGKPVFEPLMQALKDEDPIVRTGVAVALGRIGDARAVEPLIQALKDDWGGVRFEAAEALGKIGDARAEEPLTQVLSDEDRRIREAAKKALASITANSA